jgi:selenophosphate synthase
VRDAVKAGFTTDGARRNSDYLGELVRWARGNEEDKAVLYDPQTSGGLAVAVGRNVAANYLSRVAGSTVIGEVIDRGEVAIEVQ